MAQVFAEVRPSSHHLWGEAEGVGCEKGKRNETEVTSRGKTSRRAVNC